MNSSGISYRAFMTGDHSDGVTSLIALSEREKFQAVMWDASLKRWIYAPGIAVGLLYRDDYDQKQKAVDRATAERLAREFLHTDLPSEETILAMYEEGARKGWTYGPPRS